MLGSQLLARSMLIAGAVPPRSWGSCAPPGALPRISPVPPVKKLMYNGRLMYDGLGGSSGGAEPLSSSPAGSQGETALTPAAF